MYDEYFSKIVEKKLENIYTNRLDINLFKIEEELIQKKIIEEIFHIIYGDDLNLINDIHIKLVRDLILSDKANCELDLPSNYKAVKEYNHFYINKTEMVNNNYDIELVDEVRIPNNKTVMIVEEDNSTNNFCTRINSQEIKLPLRVRTRIDGDKMTIKNMEGSKKINDIFIDEKISKTQRDEWPVVIDGDNQVIWLPGLKKSKFDKEINETYDIILKYE